MFTSPASTLILASLLAALSLLAPQAGRAEATNQGIGISYALPVDGKFPRTYLVTLAITAPDNPDWIVSTFVAGQVRTVTAENQGQFTENWDGLDDNHMPVPPGDYGVKGIYTPAYYWEVDEEWHAITAKFAGGVSPWLPDPENPEHWKQPLLFKGDPVGQPLRDVDVGPNGVAVFYYQYLENGLNAPMFDLNKPLGYEQFIDSFNSGGAAGGWSVATDGESVWAAGEEGGPRFIYRTDQKPFGNGNGAYRKNVTINRGKVTSMDTWKDPASGQSYLYVAERGKFDIAPPKNRYHKYGKFTESTEEFINDITVYAGADGERLSRIKIEKPQSIIVHEQQLYCLSDMDGRWILKQITLDHGLPLGEWETTFDLPKTITPCDMEIDSKGRFYFSDSEANKVYQLNAKGKILRTLGRLDAQEPGSYDPLSFMSPGKLATWVDSEGKDRLIITEYEGPNRVSEWAPDKGTLIQEYPSYQTKVNNGYAVDPADPNRIYLPTHGNWLTAYHVDYDTHTWTVEAVWPDVHAGQHGDIDKPVAIRANHDTLYIAGGRKGIVYRLDEKENRFYKSAGILREGRTYKLWNDANGNGAIDESELRATNEVDGWILTYHGQRFIEDLSYLSPAQHGKSVWRLPVDHFDSHGNPVYTEFQKVVTDPVFEAREAGKVSALYGGNELAETYSSDWMMADGSVEDGFYVHARGGKNFTANFGAQYKITRYVPDGDGNYVMKWRVGRSNLMQPEHHKGDIIGGSRLFKPINGILTLIDQSRSGLYLYTDDGMYLDTVFPSEKINKEVGVYRQPGEFFAGSMFANETNGTIYYAAGKYTPFLYEMENWSLESNPVRALEALTKHIQLKATQIADPLPIAVTLRGGAGKTNIAPFAPAVGGAALDGSLLGWESVSPVSYETGEDQGVEVRCLFDPEHLYLRWHVRTGGTFELKPTPPLERIFTHDQETDTVSFYIQGDENAAADSNADGRPGDVRMVFGLFEQDGQPTPVILGMYPKLNYDRAETQTYRTPVGEVSFEHVGPIHEATLGAVLDADGKGYVIAAKIPRSAIPAIGQPFSGDFRTMVNFSANLGGHNKFWWANADGSANIETYDEPSEARLYPGSWAPAKFSGLSDGYVIRHWQKLGPFGGSGADAFTDDPRHKEPVKKFFHAAGYPPDDAKVDLDASYTGELIQGYWPELESTSWEPVEIEPLDTRASIGRSSQIWYGVTWIYAPEAVELDFEFQGHNMTYIRWFLNGVKLFEGDPDKHYTAHKTPRARRVAFTPVTLKQGWNEVYFRAFNVGYTPFRVGLKLKADTDKLWPLKFSNHPAE
ncbi:hypothetical protein [Coraliomargarita parva]|uniref:hypothetical protein n=1 Tax=Coraliomargarita parva TaxID=3014050 RepID=UPI0022B42159|nr:hypothetical protein [Coraliomargarita parva]